MGTPRIAIAGLTLGLLIASGGRAEACATGGLVGHWPIAGDAADVSGCGNGGTVTGSTLVPDLAGNPDHAYRFSNATDVIDLGTSAELKPTLPATIVALVRHDCGSYCTIFSNDRQSGAPETGLWLDLYNNQLLGGYGDGTGSTSTDRRVAVGGTILAPNVWHHVAVVVRGPNDFELYVDGRAETVFYSGSGGALDYDGNATRIGNTSAFEAPFDGDVDQLRLYDRALSPSEIKDLSWLGRVAGHQKISDLEGYLSNPGSPGTNPGGLLSSFDYFGSVASLGDLDGDGVVDIAVGANGENDGGDDLGMVFILLLNSDGTVKSRVSIGDGDVGIVLANNDFFGRAIANVGDVDGDGLTDVAVSAYGQGDGAVYIVFLNATGTPHASARIASGVGGGPNLLAGDRFGWSVGALGDINADGVPDVGVGARDRTSAPGNTGALFVLFLKGGVGEPAPGEVLGTPIEITQGSGGLVGPLGDNDRFGDSVAAIGDLDGDLRPEIAVGQALADIGLSDSGALWILSLCTAAAGDANIGEVCSENSFDTTEPLLASELGAGDSFGTSVSGLGDIDGDGVPDVAVGASEDDDNGSGKGAVYLLSLRADKTLARVEKISETRGGFTADLDTDDSFGWDVALLGDLGNNGTLELASAAPLDDDDSTDAGALYLLSLDYDSTCGDFIHEPVEQCDDGNIVAGDGCSSLCVAEFCGDGTAQPLLGETCDDGNAIPGDGCNDQCVVEVCGDGTLQPGLGEACDDGNLTSGDGCNDQCVVEFCGDGTLQSLLGETCDDGNLTSGDGCTDLCIAEVCGDGVLQPALGEACDDGNTMGLDGCSATCAVEESVTLLGTAAGGSVDYSIAGTTVSIATSGGDTAAQVAAALAAAINANSTLSGMGIVAGSNGGQLVHNAIPDDFGGTDIGIALGTTIGSVIGDASTIPRLLDFERLVSGDPVPNTSSLEGVTFGYATTPLVATVTDVFETASNSNTLGLNSSDDAFLDGDALSLTLPLPVLALGLSVVTSDPAAAGEIRLTTVFGTTSNVATPTGTTADGGYVYFLSQLANDPMTFMTLDFAADAEVNFVYTLDDVRADVPVQAMLGFAGVADGGYTIGVTVDGVTVTVTTVAGWTAAQAAQALADAINADSALQAQGIAASADGDVVLTNGPIDSDINEDPGLGGAPVNVPVQGPAGAALLAALLAAAGVRRLRRRPTPSLEKEMRP